MNPLPRYRWWLLCWAALAPLTSTAQLYLALTPESYLHHDSVPRPARYHIEGTSSFVDALVAAHLEGKLTLYRDYERSLPYPGKVAFDQYLSELRHPEWDAPLARLAEREAGVRDSLRNLQTRQQACDDCLALTTRWLLQAGRDSATLRNRAGGSPELQLSLYKQILKARNRFRRMAGLNPRGHHRYLLFTARYQQSEEQASLTWEQGVLLVSHYPLGDRSQPARLEAVFFDPEDRDVPWFLLKASPLLAGIREETGAQALLTESRIDMTPLGYRLITEEQQGDWQALHHYTSGEARAADSLRKDSAQRSWQLERALLAPDELVNFYPRQSKTVSLWLDGRWTPDNLAQQGLNEWALDEIEDADWEATHLMLTRLTPQLLSDWSGDTLPMFRVSEGERHLRRGESQSFPAMLAAREQYARRHLGLLPPRTRSADTAQVDPDSLPPLPAAWRDLSAQTYSWRIRGEYAWLNGLHTFVPLWLDLYWHPPVDTLAPYPLLSLAWADLEQRNYLFDEAPLSEVLIERDYGYYPTRVNQTQLDDLNRATMARQILQEGAWDAFPEWLIHAQDPPGSAADPEDAWKDAWREVRRAMRRTVY